MSPWVEIVKRRKERTSNLIWNHMCINVFQSVKKTGRCLVSHEAPITMGFAAEIAATIQVGIFTEAIT